MALDGIKGGLARLVERGGLYADIQGNSPREVLSAFINAVTAIPPDSREKLLGAVLEREALMPTCIGKGIALPHPRNPFVLPGGEGAFRREDGQFAAFGFLARPVDWNALDGEKVDTLLLVVSSTTRQHLQTLSAITFFCGQESFRRLLKDRVPLAELLGYIRETEKNWN